MPQDVQDTPARQADDSGKSGDKNAITVALIGGVCTVIVAAIYVFGPHLWPSNSSKPVPKPTQAIRASVSPNAKPPSAPSASGGAQAPPASPVSVSAVPSTSAPASRSLPSLGSGPCQDVTTASAEIHPLPASSKPSDPTLAKGATIYGTCTYYSLSTSFYMQVTYSWPDGTGKFGYIWMGNLLHASKKHCYRSNYKGVTGYSTYSLGGAACPAYASTEAPS